MHTTPNRSRGISLVEALIALVVMAFGMLALVGIQSTLRASSDIAKQRSEAVRIAQESIEQARGYSVLEPTAGRTAYADLVTLDGQAIDGYTTNTSYHLTREVIDRPAQNHKLLRVEVRWYDRTSDPHRGAAPQHVTLSTVVARADPALTAVLVTPPVGNPNLRPRGRHATIPPEARDMGGGLSAFKPPQPGGGTVVWVFDNVSGYITGLCTVAPETTAASLTSADIAACSGNTLAHLLSGSVRFATGPEQPSAADAENPTGRARNLDIVLTLGSSGHPSAPSCFDDAPTSSTAAALQLAVNYYCAIPANATRSWSGHSTVVPAAFASDAGSAWHVVATPTREATHRLCRYTPATDDSELVPNLDHPWLYRIEYADPTRKLQPLPMPNLTRQNFLVVDAGDACPTDAAADPAAGDFVNGNTLPHRPWP